MPIQDMTSRLPRVKNSVLVTIHSDDFSDEPQSPPPPVIEAAGQKYAEATESRYLSGLVTEDGELT